MVSGPPKGIFQKKDLFFHSTPCFFGFSALFFGKFPRFSGLSPRAQAPFSTPRVPKPSCSKACVKPGRWGRLLRKRRFFVPSGLVSEIGGGQKRQTPRFSKKMVSGPWRFSEIRPKIGKFAKFPKITPKIGVFPPIFADFRRFSGNFRGLTGVCPTRPGGAPNFREIFGKFRVWRDRAAAPLDPPLGPGLDPVWTRFGTRLGPVWDPVWGPFGVRLGSDLGSVWGRFGTRLGPVWDPVWDPIWTLLVRLPDVIYRVYIENFYLIVLL